MNKEIFNKLSVGYKWIITLIFSLLKSLWKQIKENWVDYFLTILIGIVLVFILRAQDQNRAEATFFQYRYNAQTNSINIQVPQDFNVFTVQGFVPSLSGTSTGKIFNGEITIKDIVSEAENNLAGSYQWSYPNSLDGYVRCVLINQFTLDSSSTSTQPLNGYPVMVKTFYTHKYNINQYKQDLGVIFINQSSLDTPTISFRGNLALQEWNTILASGNKEWNQVLKRIPFDSEQRYLTDEGNCWQQGYPVPVVHVDPMK